MKKYAYYLIERDTNAITPQGVLTDRCTVNFNSFELLTKRKEEIINKNKIKLNSSVSAE